MEIKDEINAKGITLDDLKKKYTWVEDLIQLYRKENPVLEETKGIKTDASSGTKKKYNISVETTEEK